MKCFLLLSLATLWLMPLGCAQPTTEGATLTKCYNPPQVYTTYQYVSTGNGGGYTMPVTTYIPESWGVTVSSWRYSPENKGYQQVNSYVSVSRDLYEKCELGDWFIQTGNAGERNAILNTSSATQAYPTGWTKHISPEVAEGILDGRSR